MLIEFITGPVTFWQTKFCLHFISSPITFIAWLRSQSFNGEIQIAIKYQGVNSCAHLFCFAGFITLNAYIRKAEATSHVISYSNGKESH